MNRDDLYSASEIADMAIPGLPKTRANVRLRAVQEGWYTEERIGQGGVRAVYRIPAHYLQQHEWSGGVSDLAPPAYAFAKSGLAAEMTESYGDWAASVDLMEFVPVRYYPNVRASAGYGFINSEEPPQAMLFRRSFIVETLKTSPGCLIVVRVDGDSMVPTIKRDGSVLIDLSKGLTGEGIYLVQAGEFSLVKRLQPLAGSRIKVISDNAAYAPYEIDLAKVSQAEFSVMGRYAWDAGISR